jgi:short-subunit dehydrogenase
VLGVNLGGVVNGIVTMLPRILGHGEGGHIVNTSSMSGMVPVGGTTIYSAAKSAVMTMMECMRPELEPRGVICSAFCPGAVQSNIADAARTRPEGLAETGYAEADRRRQAGGNFFHLYMTKEDVGQRVLEGILADELFILTHGEFLPGVTDRARATVAAVPVNRPQNEEYKAAFAMLFNSKVWGEEAARQAALKSGANVEGQS